MSFASEGQALADVLPWLTSVWLEHKNKNWGQCATYLLHLTIETQYMLTDYGVTKKESPIIYLSLYIRINRKFLLLASLLTRNSFRSIFGIDLKLLKTTGLKYSNFITVSVIKSVLA